MTASPERNLGWRIGLTGGIGCGKSTVAGIFRQLGFAVVESDLIVRDLWEADEDVKNAAVERWGAQIIQAPTEGQNGAGKNSALPAPGSVLLPPRSPLSISRRKVAEIVFADPRELTWLEELLHPRVRRAWQTAIEVEPARDWVVEIPLLFEKNLAKEFDYTLSIVCSPELQAARLAARGLSPAEIAARQVRQLPLQEKIDRADWVALNDGSIDFLRSQIVLFTSKLTYSASTARLLRAVGSV